MRSTLWAVLAVAAVGCSPASPGFGGARESSSAAFRWPQNQDEHQVSHPIESARLVPCTATTPRLTSDSIGPVSSGQTLLQIIERCPEAEPLWDWGEEGVPEPALVIRLGESVVTAVLEDTLPSSQVYRVLTQDPRLRTATGLGVGSTWQELVRSFGRPQTVEEAECVLYVVFAAEPTLSWQVHPGPTHECDAVAEVAAAGADANLPNSATVWRVGQFLPLPAHSQP